MKKFFIRFLIIQVTRWEFRIQQWVLHSLQLVEVFRKAWLQLW